MSDHLTKLGREFDRLSLQHLADARNHALLALDGDEAEARLAKLAHGKSQAYSHAIKIVDMMRMNPDGTLP